MSALVALSSRFELAQALPLGALEGPLRRPGRGLGVALGEQSERVVGGEAVSKAARPLALAGLSIARLGIDPKRPGRAVADDVLFLVLGDRFVGEAGKVIVGLVVFAHVIEAEAVILPLEPPFPWARGRGRAPCSRAGRKADRGRARADSGRA